MHVAFSLVVFFFPLKLELCSAKISLKLVPRIQIILVIVMNSNCKGQVATQVIFLNCSPFVLQENNLN